MEHFLFWSVNLMQHCEVVSLFNWMFYRRWMGGIFYLLIMIAPWGLRRFTTTTESSSWRLYMTQRATQCSGCLAVNSCQSMWAEPAQDRSAPCREARPLRGWNMMAKAAWFPGCLLMERYGVTPTWSRWGKAGLEKVEDRGRSRAVDTEQTENICTNCRLMNIS